MVIKVVHKETGKIYAMDKHEFLATNEFEEWKEKKEVTYSELKKIAKDKGIEFKGNISKTKLEELIKE